MINTHTDNPAIDNVMAAYLAACEMGQEFINLADTCLLKEENRRGVFLCLSRKPRDEWGSFLASLRQYDESFFYSIEGDS